ncbi:c-type cytochrome [Capnocytophaga cynodegmi]|uniref:c-type cytochrome n=1 Tax=Capnocytophaga cynodegmi TaxID=28189 RepID=UPI001EE16D53|nr:cytochrome c [Capnocytophaga cynodegmi]
MKRITTTLVVILLVFVSCKNNNQNQQQMQGSTSESAVTEKANPVTEVVDTSNPKDFMSNKGIGPVKSVTIGETIDQAMAKKGEEHFKTLCSACHRPTKKFIGPAPKDILKRRSPEWVMNMIMNPEEMIQKDPIAMQLLKEANGAPMANQNVSEQQAREILEYFRTIE